MSSMPIREAARQGAYDAARAASLSGVPRSTVYDWSRKGVVIPSVRRSRVKLWSYEDLLTLRLVRWLRLEKPDAARSSMAEVRRALDRFGDDLWTDDQAPTLVAASDGTVVHLDRAESSTGQRVLEPVMDLFARYEHGVDLRTPRSHLRLVPGRCGSEIHLHGTRLTSLTVHGLLDRGYDLDDVVRLYPAEDPRALGEAAELEQELARAA